MNVGVELRISDPAFNSLAYMARVELLDDMVILLHILRNQHIVSTAAASFDKGSHSSTFLPTLVNFCVVCFLNNSHPKELKGLSHCSYAFPMISHSIFSCASYWPAVCSLKKHLFRTFSHF